MTTTLAAALTSLALALTQAEPTAPAADAAPPSASPTVKVPAGLTPAGAPSLRADAPVRCLYGPSGAFRAQCDEAARRCLVAPDALLDEGGHPTGPLERAEPCTAPAYKEADLAGWTLRPALADAPPGFVRDERQRASQVSFDLDRRLWLGVGWSAGGQPWQPAGVAATSTRVDLPFTWDGAAALARVRLLEGWTSVDGHVGEVTALAVDLSRTYPQPLVRLTTFVGRPRRFDLPLDVGLWAEALHFESLKTRSGQRFERTAAAAAAVTFDLWRARDMASYVRLRTGAGYEKVSHRDDADWAVLAMLEGELRLDEAGLTAVKASTGTDLVLPAGAGPVDPLPDRRFRHHARAELERVVFSVNDQPVSLALELRAGRRTDVPDWPTGWTAEATAQLRVSLWAPPLRSAARQAELTSP